MMTGSWPKPGPRWSAWASAARSGPAALDVRQEDVERDRLGGVLACHGQRGGAQRRDQALEALVARRVEQHAREAQVVLDDQQHAVAPADVLPVVAGLVDPRHRLGL